MDLRKLKTIVELFENSAIDEIELVEGEERIRLSKSSAVARNAVAAPAASAQVQNDAADQAAVEQARVMPAAEQQETGGFAFTSPMVGTFYAAPAPDKEPFVSIGDTVAKGDEVCVIEAMKLMNKVQSPVSGKILAIHVRDGHPVAYGDLLMTIGE